MRPDALSGIAADGSSAQLVVPGVPNVQPTSEFVDTLIATAADLVDRGGSFEQLVRVRAVYRWPMPQSSPVVDRAALEWRNAHPTLGAIVHSVIDSLRIGGLLASSSIVVDGRAIKLTVDPDRMFVGGFVHVDVVERAEDVAL